MVPGSMFRVPGSGSGFWLLVLGSGPDMHQGDVMSGI